MISPRELIECVKSMTDEERAEFLAAIEQLIASKFSASPTVPEQPTLPRSAYEAHQQASANLTPQQKKMRDWAAYT
jgi:hypothetical protein